MQTFNFGNSIGLERIFSAACDGAMSGAQSGQTLHRFQLPNI